MRPDEIIVTKPSETNMQTNGFIIISKISKENQQKIHSLQDKIIAAFPKSKFWFPRAEQLHNIFAHIISPDITYPRSQVEIFNEIKNDVTESLKSIIPNKLNFQIKFNNVEAFESAIIISGHDDGTIDRLRKQFSESVTIPAETRRPPSIIHSTIARYYGEYDLGEMQEFVNKQKISFTQVVNTFLLIHEKKLYVQEYDIIESFPS